MVGQALNLASLGLYSPWAKLRRLRYLFGHTQMLGSRFEFDASPWTILLSRLIVLTVIILASWADYSYPFIDGATLGLGTVVITLALPAAIMRGRAFHARHTLFKGIRFRFASCYRQLYLYYLLMFLPFIVLLTQVHLNNDLSIETSELDDGLLASIFLIWTIALPGLSWFEHRILANHLRLGKLALAIAAPVRDYYLMAARRALMTFLITAVCTGLMLAAGSSAITVMPAMIVLAVLWSIMLFKIDAVRLFWKNLRFADGSAIASNITFGGLLKVFTINSLTIIASIGILWPMARARKWRYITENIGIVPGSQLAEIRKEDDEKAIAALGEEGSDILGFDFDAGLI